MASNHNPSRRTMLKLGVGGAAAVALAPLGPVSAFAAPKAGSGNGRLIPPSKVGTITFTQRDVPGRLGIAASAALGVSPTMGYLGGANFPADPSDLGPLVPLPGGWKELFEYFAKVGIEQVEFAGYGQNAANPGGTASYVNSDARPRPTYLAYAQRLARLLDDNGLEVIGNHGFIPNTWDGPGSSGGAMIGQRPRPVPRPSWSSGRSWARPTWAPAMTRPTRTTATSSRGRSRARSGRRSTRSASTSSASTCIRTTTPPRTTSCRTARS